MRYAMIFDRSFHRFRAHAPANAMPLLFALVCIANGACDVPPPDDSISPTSGPTSHERQALAVADSDGTRTAPTEPLPTEPVPTETDPTRGIPSVPTTTETLPPEPPMETVDNPMLDPRFTVVAMFNSEDPKTFYDGWGYGTTWHIASPQNKARVYLTLKRGMGAPDTVKAEAIDASVVNVNGVPATTVYGNGDNFWAIFNVARDESTDSTLAITGGVFSGGYFYAIKPTSLVYHRSGKFAEIAPTFSHDRCTTCHSLGDSSAWEAFHGFVYMPNIDVGNPVVCANCHNKVNDWRAPPFAKQMDWNKIVTDKDRCLAVTGHLTTTQKILDHFNQDPRLQWAYYDGSPCNMKSYLPKRELIPDPARFLENISAWVAEGATCEGLDLPRHPHHFF